MARLPQPGGDDGNWGTILNDYLATAHNADGTLKSGSVATGTVGIGAITTANLQDGSVTATKLSASSPTSGQVLGYSGSALAWTTPSGAPTATNSTTGTITLAGDLAGTAASPTVPGLATKATDSTVVHLAGSETVTGAKNFTGGLQSAGQAVVVTNDARLSDQRTPTDLSVTTAKLSAGAGTDGQVLSYSAGNLLWTTASTTTVSDAGAGVKGILALSGDLSGTAALPTVPGLATKADDSTVVHLAGVETITGNKAFSGTLQVGGQAVVVTNDTRLSDQRTPTDASVTPTKLSAAAAPTTGQVLSYNGTQFNWIAPAAGGGSNGYSFTILHKTADYTANAYDMIFIDSTPAMVTITLPAPAANATVRVKRLAPNGNSVQVAAPVGSYIDASSGVGTDTLNTQFMSQDYWSDGSNWFRV